ncbi:hypothetical protein MBANPS3_012292 [Mucor bainieri]
MNAVQDGFEKAISELQETDNNTNTRIEQKVDRMTSHFMKMAQSFMIMSESCKKAIEPNKEMNDSIKETNESLKLLETRMNSVLEALATKEPKSDDMPNAGGKTQRNIPDNFVSLKGHKEKGHKEKGHKEVRAAEKVLAFIEQAKDLNPVDNDTEAEKKKKQQLFAGNYSTNDKQSYIEKCGIDCVNVTSIRFDKCIDNWGAVALMSKTWQNNFSPTAQSRKRTPSEAFDDDNEAIDISPHPASTSQFPSAAPSSSPLEGEPIFIDDDLGSCPVEDEFASQNTVLEMTSQALEEF